MFEIGLLRQNVILNDLTPSTRLLLNNICVARAKDFSISQLEPLI